MKPCLAEDSRRNIRNSLPRFLQFFEAGFTLLKPQQFMEFQSFKIFCRRRRKESLTAATLRPTLFDVLQNFRHNLSLWLGPLRTAVV